MHDAADNPMINRLPSGGRDDPRVFWDLALVRGQISPLLIKQLLRLRLTFLICPPPDARDNFDGVWYAACG